MTIMTMMITTIMIQKNLCHLSGPTEPEAEERGRQQRGREGRPSTCCVQCTISKIKIKSMLVFKSVEDLMNGDLG